MKNRTINNLKNIRLFFLLFLLVAIDTHAQPPFPGDVEDVPTVPVDGWIIPVIVLGLILGCYIIRKSIINNKIN
ncbi:hypothetical protein [Flavobacterium piscis]|uniref:Uncharacterized protein n=1 Tax=Flavobacterium piscis TaxID=1114874 RepID=A0ABU1Y4R6_9FLAO|nr:hypothetical protein [Flavobacterium piscis]MDR7209217.1 hypothetical protein [Flavobacterium piscis]